MRKPCRESDAGLGLRLNLPDSKDEALAHVAVYQPGAESGGADRWLRTDGQTAQLSSPSPSAGLQRQPGVAQEALLQG